MQMTTVVMLWLGMAVPTSAVVDTAPTMRGISNRDAGDQITGRDTAWIETYTCEKICEKIAEGEYGIRCKSNKKKEQPPLLWRCHIMRNDPNKCSDWVWTSWWDRNICTVPKE